MRAGRKTRFTVTCEKEEKDNINNNRQEHWKIRLSTFHLNGHTLVFHPQTQK